MIEHVISDLGKQMGIANLSFDSQGLICLTSDSIDLYLERLSGGVLAYITQAVPYIDVDTYFKLMAACHYQNKSVAYANPGITQDGKLLLAMRFEEDGLSGRELHTGLLHLQTRMESIIE